MTSVSKTSLIWVPSEYANKLQEFHFEVKALPAELREVFWEDIITAMENRLRVLKKVK